jgi:outer membrane protein assembly factor BamB
MNSPKSLRKAALAGGTLLAFGVVAVMSIGSTNTQPGTEEKKAGASDHTMFGGTTGRNMVNLTDKGVPEKIDPEGPQLLWKAPLGSRAYGGPIIAHGKIVVGTNNEQPRNKRDTMKLKTGETEPIDRGVVMCFDERTGKFLWQAVHDKLQGGIANDWPQQGIASTPAVDGNRVYYVSNRAEVMCVDANGFADGNQGVQNEQYKTETDADVIWSFDMIGQLKVYPHSLAACPPLVVGDLVYVVTGNGVGEDHLKLPSPDAPSFIALDKKTGKLVWKDNSPGKGVLHGQWGIPSYAAEPVPMVIFPGGDGWLRAFDPPTGKLLWKFDCNPKAAKHDLAGGTGDRNDFVNCAPVVANGRVYIGTGQDPEHSTGHAYLWCIDLKRAVEFGAKNKDADVSPVNDNFDPAAAVNKNSALAWAFGGEPKSMWAERDFKFGRTMSSVCVVDDVVYAAELYGFVHCLNAKTGQRYWVYDTKASIWGSPVYADGKVFIGNDNGDLYIFRHRTEPKPFADPEASVAGAANLKEARMIRRDLRKELEAAVVVRKIEFDQPIRTTPSVANGVLYVNTDLTLYAIGKK